MSPQRTNRVLRGLARVLLASGVVCLAWYAADALHTRWYQYQQEAALERAIARAAAPTERPQTLPGDDAAPAPTLGSSPTGPAAGTTGLAVPGHTPVSHPTAPTADDENLIGRIEVKRLGISAIVRTGEDTATLQSAVGHLPGTPRPGETGNVALAAHRDSFFRGLRNVRTGDRIAIVTPRGEYIYEVRKTFVVDPGDVWVLDAASGNTLTLITCYPFNYVGHAPHRFIVRADEVSAPPRSKHRLLVKGTTTR